MICGIQNFLSTETIEGIKMYGGKQRIFFISSSLSWENFDLFTAVSSSLIFSLFNNLKLRGLNLNNLDVNGNK